jgi:hypothetical protein
LRGKSRGGREGRAAKEDRETKRLEKRKRARILI